MEILKIKPATLLFMIITTVMFQSCSGLFKNIRRDDLMSLHDLSALNGTYQNISRDTSVSKMPLWSALNFDYKNLTPDKFPDSFYSVKFSAQGSRRMRAELLDGPDIKQTIILKGKKKGGYFSVRRKVKYFGLPFVYLMYYDYKMQFGKDSSGNLVYDGVRGSLGWIFIISAGSNEEYNAAYPEKR